MKGLARQVKAALKKARDSALPAVEVYEQARGEIQIRGLHHFDGNYVWPWPFGFFSRANWWAILGANCHPLFTETCTARGST